MVLCILKMTSTVQSSCEHRSGPCRLAVFVHGAYAEKTVAWPHSSIIKIPNHGKARQPCQPPQKVIC